MEGLSNPCFWLPDFSPITPPVAPSKDQNHEERPGAHPLPSPALKHTWRCLPSPAGAWSWSSCTDIARRPAERGRGLSWPSGGGQGIRVWSQQLPPLQPFLSTFRFFRGAKFPAGTPLIPSPILMWGLVCLFTFISGAQTRILWEAQAVWGGTGFSGAGTRGRGSRTILLAPTTAPKLCIQLLPQCLPGGRLRSLAPCPRSAGGVCKEKGVSQDLSQALEVSLTCTSPNTAALTHQQTQSGCGT